jgi:hypothetical protein
LGFEILKAVNIKASLFRDVTPSILVGGYNIQNEYTASIFSSNRNNGFIVDMMLAGCSET